MRASVNRPILRPLSFALMVVVFLVIIGRNLYVNSINARLATAVQTGRLTEVIALLDQHANPRYIAQVTVPQSGDSSRPTSYYPAATLSLALDRLLQADRNLLRLLYPAAPPGAPQKAPAPDLDSPGIKAAQAQYAEAEEIVCLLLRRGANPVSEPDQESYLAKACDCGSLKVMRLLFEMAPDIDRLDEKGGAPGIAHGYGRAAAIYPGPETQAQFERYCALKSQAMLKLLQEHGARLNLAQAVYVRDMETLHRLIPKSRPTELGATVEAALAWQDQDLMRLLLESGVNPNEALIGAVRKNDLSMVRFLLNRGADASVSTKADYLSRSVSSGNASVPTYTSPLCQAVAMRQPTLVRLLLESGAVVNPSDAGSNQPLIVAAIAGDVESTRLLLQHGALVNAHDHKDYPDSAPPRALGIPAGTAGSRKPVLTPSTMVIAPGKMAVASSTPAFVPGEPIVVPGRPALVSGAPTLASRRPVTPPERTALYYARKYHHSEVAALLEQAGGRTDVP